MLIKRDKPPGCAKLYQSRRHMNIQYPCSSMQYPAMKHEIGDAVILILYLQEPRPMQSKVILFAVLVALAMARSYPLYKQCDSKWGSQQLGTSSNTICKAGCLMSSVAMALTGAGKSYNPGTLNTWLKGHGGYVSGDLFVWGSVSSLGLKYIGKVGNSNIASSLSAGHVVILNVHNGGHWVLATSMSGSTIQVNDPGYSTTSYTLSQIVANNSGLFHVGNSFLGMMIDELEIALNVNGRRDRLRKTIRGMIESQ